MGERIRLLGGRLEISDDNPGTIVFVKLSVHLWQVHGVAFDNDPDLFIRLNGAAEALEKAKRDGKVRFVGFTGHHQCQSSSG